jgi:hypothetical protein
MVYMVVFLGVPLDHRPTIHHPLRNTTMMTMTPAQEQNVRWQEMARMRMEQAAERRAEAQTQEQWDHAQKVWEAHARDWQDAVREAAEWHNA